jgi:hypothetical protein
MDIRHVDLEAIGERLTEGWTGRSGVGAVQLSAPWPG